MPKEPTTWLVAYERFPTQHEWQKDFNPFDFLHFVSFPIENSILRGAASLPVAEGGLSSGTLTRRPWSASTIWACCCKPREGWQKPSHCTANAWRSARELRVSAWPQKDQYMLTFCKLKIHYQSGKPWFDGWFGGGKKCMLSAWKVPFAVFSGKWWLWHWAAKMVNANTQVPRTCEFFREPNWSDFWNVAASFPLARRSYILRVFEQVFDFKPPLAVSGNPTIAMFYVVYCGCCWWDFWSVSSTLHGPVKNCFDRKKQPAISYRYLS